MISSGPAALHREVQSVQHWGNPVTGKILIIFSKEENKAFYPLFFKIEIYVTYNIV